VTVTKMLIMDQYHLTVLAPRDLIKPHRRRISKVLNRSRFRQELARAVRAVFAHYPELSQVRVWLSC
jgi:hypothetical protein